MDSSQIYLYTSLFSFLLMIVTGVVALFQPHDGEDIVLFWTIITDSGKYSKDFFSILINSAILYISFIILLLLAIASGAFIIIYRNDSNVKSGLFGTISRYHFIPIICASCLYIIGEALGNKNSDNDGCFICSFIFSIIGLCCTIFIYFKTDIPSPFHVRLVTKKGLYPCLIALFIYNICFSFGYYGFYKKTVNLELDTLLDWVKGCSIAFSIIMGLVNLALSFAMKDICLAGMNFLIYLGLIIYFFSIDKKVRKEMNGEAEGAIDIIMDILSATLIAFLIFKYKNTTLN